MAKRTRTLRNKGGSKFEGFTAVKLALVKKGMSARQATLIAGAMKAKRQGTRKKGR